jgi:hypothetical protein
MDCPFAICAGRLPVYTSAECRAQPEEKLKQAEQDDRNRDRLITAAEAWLFLASQLRRAEAAFVPTRRKKNYGVVDRTKRLKRPASVW